MVLRFCFRFNFVWVVNRCFLGVLVHWEYELPVSLCSLEVYDFDLWLLGTSRGFVLGFI